MANKLREYITMNTFMDAECIRQLCRTLLVFSYSTLFHFVFVVSVGVVVMLISQLFRGYGNVLRVLLSRFFAGYGWGLMCLGRRTNRRFV